MSSAQRQVMLLLLLTPICHAIYAQHFNLHNPIILPDKSQAASIHQKIGYTDISIAYHSPGTHGRSIWGEVVPYGKVWRAGANTNTIFSISDSATIEGFALPAGSYGLHVLPEETHWTFIFSRDHTSWGSYFYDPSQDALRIRVPVEQAPEIRPWLSYDFHHRARESVVVMLTWGDRRAAFKVTLNVDDIALDHIRKGLKTDAFWEWFSWCQAADYCAQYEINTEEALVWIDRSIEMQENFANWDVKAKLLLQLDRNNESSQALARAIEVGSDRHLERYGRRLMGDGEVERAIDIFDQALIKNAAYWRTHLSKGLALMELKKWDEARLALELAKQHAPEHQLAGISDRIKAIPD